MKCKEILSLGQKDGTCIALVISLKEKDILNFYVCKVNDLGCVLTNQKLSGHLYISKFKLQTFLLVRMWFHRMVVYKGYSDSILAVLEMNPPQLSHQQTCTDSKKNLVVDSYDNTVHLLDPNGKVLGVIMLAEDGLRGVKCVAMDDFGWLWLGCKDGALHFANYQHFKTTTRKERRLLKQN
jgi:hypothetical protein